MGEREGPGHDRDEKINLNQNCMKLRDRKRAEKKEFRRVKQ